MPKTEWKSICAACAEGTAPGRCAYYGDPNGCNAPTLGQHPEGDLAEQLQEELEKAERRIAELERAHGNALAAPARACDVLAKERLASDIIKAIDEGVPGWAKVSELEKSLAYAVVNATVNAAYSTAVVKADEPNDEQHGGAPAPDGAERDANGDTK